MSSVANSDREAKLKADKMETERKKNVEGKRWRRIFNINHSGKGVMRFAEAAFMQKSKLGY